MASRWLKSELKGADIEFTYLSCDDKLHYGYSVFLVNKSSLARSRKLSIKIAEINETPQAFCEIGIDGETNTFPLITDLESSRGRQQLLHYITDFVLSAE
jgi:hypothetical protein